MWFYQVHQYTVSLSLLSQRNNITKVVQEVKFPDLSYLQNNWEENPEVIQDSLWTNPTVLLWQLNILQGIHPLISLWYMGKHNYQVLWSTQWISHKKYRRSRFGLTHNLKVTIKISHGVPPLRSILPFVWHNYPVIPITKSFF